MEAKKTSQSGKETSMKSPPGALSRALILVNLLLLGQFQAAPPLLQGPWEWKNHIGLQGLALHHPAASKLLQYATDGCRLNTSKDWTQEQMQQAIDRGHHVSALDRM